MEAFVQMKWRVHVQPVMKATTFTSAEVRYALATGHAKSVVHTINIFDNTSSDFLLFTIFGASSLDLKENIDILATGFWKNTGSQTSFSGGATGTQFCTVLDYPPAYLRWRLTGLITGAVSFEVIADLWDH